MRARPLPWLTWTSRPQLLLLMTRRGRQRPGRACASISFALMPTVEWRMTRPSPQCSQAPSSISILKDRTDVDVSHWPSLFCCAFSLARGEGTPTCRAPLVPRTLPCPPVRFGGKHTPGLLLVRTILTFLYRAYVYSLMTHDQMDSESSLKIQRTSAPPQCASDVRRQDEHTQDAPNSAQTRISSEPSRTNMAACI